MKRLVITLASIVAACVLLLVLRAVYTLYTVGSFRKAWLAGISQPTNEGSVVLAVLGDSTAQGIGGFKKEDGFVGQVAARISVKTKKPVQIYNYSLSGGDSDDVLKNQLPAFKKLERYDVVLIAVGPNDITHKKNLKDFLSNYEKIFAQLPAEKVVISNMPPMGPKDVNGNSSLDWSRAIVPLANKYNVSVAKVYENIAPRANDVRTYGGDFYHPSKEGYRLWANAFTPPVEAVLKIK